MNPRDVVAESNMPAYPWLENAKVDAKVMPLKFEAMRKLGVPYTDEEIKNSAKEVEGKTELEAVIAYLQGLGTVLRNAK